MEHSEQEQDNYTGMGIKWHTPIALPDGSVRLPAIFLKKHNLLKEVLDKDYEFNENCQYAINFDEFKVDGKTIDDLFDEYECQLPPYPEMFRYCSFLYPPPYVNKEAGIDTTDETKKQFKREYKKFRKCLCSRQTENPDAISDDDIKKYDPKLDRSDMLKIFILYRSLKARVVKNPLDFSQNSLPDGSEFSDKKLKSYDIDDIFLANLAVSNSENKKKRNDDSSIAPLFNDFHSPNGFFIEKLYAMLWYNAKFAEGEIQGILNYIITWESAAKELQFANEAQCFLYKVYLENLHKNRQEAKEHALTETSKYISRLFKEKISVLKSKSYFDSIDPKTEDNSNSTSSISLFSYFIIKIYMENRIRLCEIEAEITNCADNSISTGNDIDINLLGRIRKAVKDVKIIEAKNFLQIFDKTAGLISSSMRKDIINFIYLGNVPSEGRGKSVRWDKKISKIEKNYPNICVLYTQWWSAYPKQHGSESPEDEELCFHLIVASYLFFVCNKIEIKRARAKRYNNSKFNVATTPTPNNIFSQFREKITLENATQQNESINQINKNNIFDAKEFNFYDIKTKLHLRRFYPLFYGRQPIARHDYQMIVGTMTKEFVTFWKEAMLNTYKFV